MIKFGTIMNEMVNYYKGNRSFQINLKILKKIPSKLQQN